MSHGDLFGADLFSNSTVIFSEVESSIKKEIQEAFLNFYPDLGVPTKIVKSGALEINSKNFKLDTPKGPILIKKVELKPEDVGLIEKQQSLVAWLFEQGVLVPKPIISVEGKHLCHLGQGQYLLAMDFVTGSFFAGQASSLNSVSHEIGKLQKALSQAPKKLQLERQYPAITDLDKECFAKVLGGDGKEAFPKEEALLITESLDLLSRCWQRVLGELETLASGPTGMIHIDLHPHNILMEGDQVKSFIDFDSLMQGPLNIMVGFSSFKLLRQVAELEKTGKFKEWGQQFFSGIYQEAPELKALQSNVSQDATTELCRRIATIFRFNLLENNSQWNHVLKIQIQGLQEIEALFEP